MDEAAGTWNFEYSCSIFVESAHVFWSKNHCRWLDTLRPVAANGCTDSICAVDGADLFQLDRVLAGLRLCAGAIQ